MQVVLDNLRSIHNTGSIFRTSDALGVKKIHLCGTTPEPNDRLGYPRQKFSKVSLGSENSVSWQYTSNTLECVRNLKKEGFTIIAVEQSEKSIPFYQKDTLPSLDFIVLIMGNEVDGVSESVLQESDYIMEIPMIGKKESLNVSVVFGIVGFFLRYS